MRSLDLGAGRWSLYGNAFAEPVPAEVPGCVHTDLRRANLIPDPFRGANELDLQWIEEADWEYVCTFTPEPDLLDHDRVELVVEGLDTVARVTLNGVPLFCSDNMFHVHRIDVTRAIVAGENRLSIAFTSALAYIRETRTDFTPPREFNDPVGCSVRIRKQQCQFGWDWGPRFVTAGVWRPIRLEGWTGNRIDNVSIEQVHRADGVEIVAIPITALPIDQDVRLHVYFGEECVASAQGAELRCVISDPRLWWPAGHGDQPLYRVEVEILAGETVLDRWTRSIGLRTIQLDMGEDAHRVEDRLGNPLGRFSFRVNGRLIFAKGANWIPAHSFVNEASAADYETLIRAATAANMNMLRVWGGGIYESECFYDLCDRYGLLVWQDFMFACPLYPSDDAFIESVRREVADQARRIRHHACLALWCGNNELVLLNEAALAQPAFAEGYDRLFLRAIPDELRLHDRTTAYIHSSPCLPIEGLPASRTDSQDAHDWKVWHDRFPVDHYEETEHRFMSEFGMQSYPSPAVAHTFCDADDLNIFAPAFDNHQKNVGGNQVIFDYVSRRHRFPKSYADLSYLSQLNQAFCMRTAVEHCRHNMPRTLGTLYWQLNDCWPAASWSGLEFGGEWRALHYAAKKFYAPTLLSVHQQRKSVRTIGNYALNESGPVEFRLAHDGPEPVRATLRWRLQDFAGNALAGGIYPVAICAGQAMIVAREDLTPLVASDRNAVVLVADLMDEDGAPIAEVTSYFALPLALALQKRPIRIERRQDGYLLSSDTLHYAVQLQTGIDGVDWTDNYFDLIPGREKFVKALSRRSGEAEIVDDLRVSSLVDSY